MHGRIRDQKILIASLIAGGGGVDEAERSLQDFERTQRHHLAEIERIKGALRLRWAASISAVRGSVSSQGLRLSTREPSVLPDQFPRPVRCRDVPWEAECRWL